MSISVHTSDDETYRIWSQEIGIPTKRLLRLGDGDNFWPANAPKEGPEGPGGCCSEIFWDHRTNSDPNDNLASSTGRFVEIWNLVSPEFNVRPPHADGSPNLERLGRSNIDTGSGLERVAAVMQGVYNNFDIDIFQTIIRQVTAVTAVPYVKDAAEGFWRHEGKLFHDNLGLLVVDLPDTTANRKWMKAFKERWKRRLDQLEIWMVSYSIDIE